MECTSHITFRINILDIVKPIKYYQVNQENIHTSVHCMHSLMTD